MRGHSSEYKIYEQEGNSRKFLLTEESLKYRGYQERDFRQILTQQKCPENKGFTNKMGFSRNNYKRMSLQKLDFGKNKGF